MDPITSTCHPTAESGARDSGGPIFELAEECKMLFTNYIAKLSDSEEHNGAKILLEIYQRFAASATSLGVFEKLHLSLKDTIRHNFDAKDQLLRLLDILQRNLTYLFEPDPSSEHTNIDSIDENWLSDPTHKLSSSSFEAISGAVDRLNTLDNLIQRSSLVNQSTKVRNSDGNLHLKSFKKVAYLSLHALYEDSSQSLLEQLAESMTEMYARILAKKQHQALNAYRLRLHVLDPLYTILEKSSIDITSYEEIEESQSTRTSNTTPRSHQDSVIQKTANFLERSASTPENSISTNELLSISEKPNTDQSKTRALMPRYYLGCQECDAEKIRCDRLRPKCGRCKHQNLECVYVKRRTCQDCYRKKKRCHHGLESRELLSMLEKLKGRPLESGRMSVLENLTDYPRPPKEKLACDWCSSLVAADTMDEDYWRQHVNKDNEPYTCLSEMCSESLPKFSNSTEWLQHMLDIHGQNWHQEVHPASLWICPLCMEEEVTFTKSNDLEMHFKTVHPAVFPIAFTKYEAQAIIQHSRIQTSRPQDSCPICCLSIKDGDDYGPEGKHASNNEMCVQDAFSSSTPGIEKIGSHVAAHLESIMVLTLRLISIKSPEDNLNENKSKNNRVDDQLSSLGSWAASSHEVDFGESMNFLLGFDDERSR